MKNSLSKIFTKTKSFVINHKFWSIVIVLALVFIGYKAFGSKVSTETRYVTSTVTKGTVIASVTGSGQVEASSTIDLKPKASGDIVSVRVKSGDIVRKGQTLISLDAGDASKSLRDAKLNLEIAQTDFDNAKKDYNSTKTSKEKDLNNLLLALNSSVVSIPDSGNTNTNVITISGSYTSPEQGKYTIEIYACQNGVCANYSGLEHGSFSINTNIPQKLGDRGFYITFTQNPKAGEKWYIDVPSKASNSYALNLKAYEDGQQSIPDAIDAANDNVVAKQTALTQKQNALKDIEDNLSDYYIIAPFTGTIANLTADVGQQASSGTALGSIITKEKLASITLNEIDVAKVKVGQKATLTFDAIDGLSIAGEVAEIDSVGTVTQGVVDYTVKINFATDDERIKPGMSVSAAIITDIAQDVLYVPNSAVKTQNGASYVEVFDTPLPASTGTVGSTSASPPRQQSLETGLSNDTITEIASGLKEGDQVVTRTISSPTTKTATSTAPTIFGSPNNRGGGTRVNQGR